jgi:hypothetical protein
MACISIQHALGGGGKGRINSKATEMTSSKFVHGFKNLTIEPFKNLENLVTCYTLIEVLKALYTAKMAEFPVLRLVLE